MATSSTSNAPPRSWNSWKIPKITKSRRNEEVSPKFDAKRVVGRTNLDANKSDDWVNFRGNRNPSVSGANTHPIRDGRKTALNGYTRPCRKCNRTGHSLKTCPNDPIGGRNIEKEHSSFNSVPLAYRTVNEDGSIKNCVAHTEKTSIGDFSNRINAHSWNVRQRQQTQFIRSKPRDDYWGTNADALPSCPGFPDEPSTSGTRGVIGHAGLNNCEMQHKVMGNIAVLRQSDIEKKVKWNLKSMGQYCEIEPQKSNMEVSGIPFFNIMENYSHCGVIPALTNLREQVVQPAPVFPEFPTFLRSPTPPIFAEVCSVVWKGAIHGSDMGKFNVQALHVKNSTNHFYSLPSSLNVVGRIHPEKMWDYIDRIKCAETNDIVILKFIPACDPDMENFSYFLCQLQQRDRFAVVKPVSKHIKDIYLIPLPEGSGIPSELASLTSAVTELLDTNRKDSLLVGVVIYNIPPMKNEETGYVTVPLKTDKSIKIIPLEPLSCSLRINAIPRNSPPTASIKTPNNPQFMLRTADLIPITPDVLKNVHVDDLQKILETAQNKDNSCLRKRKFHQVDTDNETVPSKVAKVSTHGSTIPSKSSTLSVKSTATSSTDPIHICTSWSNSSIAKNIEAGWLGSQYLNVALYSPGIPMDPFKPIPVINKNLVKIQDSLMEELNSVLPAWLAVDLKNGDD